jgi:hypothetical protein
MTWPLAMRPWRLQGHLPVATDQAADIRDIHVHFCVQRRHIHGKTTHHPWSPPHPYSPQTRCVHLLHCGSSDDRGSLQKHAPQLMMQASLPCTGQHLRSTQHSVGRHLPRQPPCHYGAAEIHNDSQSILLQNSKMRVGASSVVVAAVGLLCLISGAMGSTDSTRKLLQQCNNGCASGWVVGWGGRRTCGTCCVGWNPSVRVCQC